MPRVGLVLTLAIFLLLASIPKVALGQDDVFCSAHATLRGWEEQARLAIFDRGGSFFGRTSDRGILQRFNEKMDSEYPLDLISSTFSLGETYEWYRRENGVRFWAGSINHLRLVQHGDFTATVPLGGAWATNVRFTHDETLEADRNLIRIEFRRRLFERRARAFLMGTLKAKKPETDLELGFTWMAGPGTVTVAFAALDLFSDFIYQSLEVSPSIADTALDYTSHPYTARVSLDLPLGRRLRIEGYGLVLTPTSVAVESQSNPGQGFTQDERYAYAGGLLEWTPSARTAIGGLATWVRARLDRSPLPDGRPEDAFDLTEATWRLRIYGIQRLSGRFTAEGWLSRVWRTEDRLYKEAVLATDLGHWVQLQPPVDETSDVNYEDRSWAGRLLVTYRAPSGFRGDLALDFVARDVIGTDRLPGATDSDHSRLRFDFGWQFGERALLLLGSNLDLDGDGRSPNFDGGHGRFLLYW
ncbi:MAG: hypothetical protein PVJ64_07885 [Gemmatimonadales bacterium]|jgi:hypothetical protein